MESWLVYVSDALVAQEADLTSLVADSHVRNASLRVTGALLFTGSKFAQYLEGTADALQLLMTSIRIDPRHQNIVVLAEGQREERQFARWTLAYAGPAVFVARVVQAALDDAQAGSPMKSRTLIRLLREFAEA